MTRKRHVDSNPAPDVQLCSDYMTNGRCLDKSCKHHHDNSYCKLAWSGHCPYGERCRNRHTFPAVNLADRKKAVKLARAKERRKLQALMELEIKGAVPAGSVAEAEAASVNRYTEFSDVSSSSNDETDVISKQRKARKAAQAAELFALRKESQSRAANTSSGHNSREGGGGGAASRELVAGVTCVRCHRQGQQEPAAASFDISVAVDTNPVTVALRIVPRGVSLHPCLFAVPGDETIYPKLTSEIQAVAKRQDDAERSGDQAAITSAKMEWRLHCPIFKSIVDRLKAHFGIQQLKATRFNWFKNACEGRQFHKETLGAEKFESTDVLIIVSFGATRQYALRDIVTKNVIGLPMSHGQAFAFGREVMINWLFGVFEEQAPPVTDEEALHHVSVMVWGSFSGPRKTQAEIDAAANGAEALEPGSSLSPVRRGEARQAE